MRVLTEREDETPHRIVPTRGVTIDDISNKRRHAFEIDGEVELCVPTEEEFKARAGRRRWWWRWRV